MTGSSKTCSIQAGRRRRRGRAAATRRREAAVHQAATSPRSAPDASTEAGASTLVHRVGRARRATTQSWREPVRVGIGPPARTVLVRPGDVGQRGAAARSTGPPPSTSVSDQTTFFIASAGCDPRPAGRAPARGRGDGELQAEPLRRRGGEPDGIAPLGRAVAAPAPGTTSGVPIPPSNICTPRTPTRCSHSRSSPMPSGSTLPSIQCHQARGRASSGGSQNPRQSASRSTGTSGWRRRARRPPISGRPAGERSSSHCDRWSGAKISSTANWTAPIIPATSMSTAEGSIRGPGSPPAARGGRWPPGWCRSGGRGPAPYRHRG